METRPVVLIIRDGWGENHNPAHDAFNAVKLAETPVADKLTAEWPRTELMACGLDVGLPEGVMGNSEVGHQNIGAGRIVDQEIVRIDKGFEMGTVKDNAILQGAFTGQSPVTLHLMGLVSDAGVHAMLEHLYGLLRLAKEAGLEKVFIHCFTDGRDTPPKSGMGYIKQIEEKCAEIGIGQIASVSGRFWAMDRDLRWDRVQKAYDCLTGRNVERTAPDASAAIQLYYDNPLDSSRNGDEFIVPTAIVGEDGKPVGTIKDGDSVIFFNFRGDRPRELTRAFINDEFDGFDRGDKLDLYYATMTDYQKGLCDKVIFNKPAKMPDILGTYVADKGIPQFRCAETEKFPHVTFFFNDYREEPLEGEDREMIPSPKEVATYDLKPEMSAYGIRDAADKAIRSGKYGLVVINFANADMVGHTGSKEAAIKACEVVDNCVGTLLEAVDAIGAAALITADHGNSDQMYVPETGSAHTAHTLNPVELVVYGKELKSLSLAQSGRLADIAPTILKLMGLEQPAAMTGANLLNS
ncbi:2,3-bisphosphoglycerate-independent phosphoglycerate mutase [Puniceicoccales bacterium CK1056]|uniref:2,3-bisphosphoglycerate-independent phosphoglycerate mutase n=1 Tax=Oceanipulchritudo coccoides TaxID=2706888 RepID=A0A6B2M1V1_9BACT|nr:2,3-bisphosphoglycerate-independent phosphoglycerate mutase [Oceanipulchritudo coccoides]NDV61765.1 2,3-bisphosphoglycerate-independent phosphoglycerate mutase [Oceanipulchritudo coccoides]